MKKNYKHCKCAREETEPYGSFFKFRIELSAKWLRIRAEGLKTFKKQKRKGARSLVLLILAMILTAALNQCDGFTRTNLPFQLKKKEEYNLTY